MPTQREIMRQLWQKFGPDNDRVIREYAALDMAGQVTRNSNRHNILPLEYARRLLADGLAKSWLTGKPATKRALPRKPLVLRGYKTISTEKLRQVVPSQNQIREEWATKIVRNLGVRDESEEYLERITAWRNAWRPDRVRLLLIAESHVAEQLGDVQTRVRLPVSVRTPVLIPDGFCRLVYCLGYGESAICEPGRPSDNGGTWQFWDIFGSIAACYEPSLTPEMPRRSNSDLHYRLWWKIRVLEVLRRVGVWLEDASVIALYEPGGKRRASGSAYARIVRASFESFVWPGVVLDQPEQVWVIGRGVGGALQGLPMIRESQIISQPQDRDAERRKRDMVRLLQSLPGHE